MRTNAADLESRKRRDMTLRCYVYKRGDHYLAECIDLDIAVVRDSVADARKELEAAVLGYVLTVFEGAGEGALESGAVDDLIPRPSPWSHRAHYHFLLLRAALTPGPTRNYRIFDSSAMPTAA